MTTQEVEVSETPKAPARRRQSQPKATASVLKKWSEERIVQEGVVLVKEYIEIEGHRTEVLRKLSLVAVALRSKFSDAGGKPDWAGRSNGYKEAVARIYREAGVPEDAVSGFQAALRYHIGNTLREFAPKAELKAAGLKVESPRERSASSKESRAANKAAEPSRPRRQPENVIPQDPTEVLAEALGLIQAAQDMPVRGDDQLQKVSQLCGQISAAATGLMAAAVLAVHEIHGSTPDMEGRTVIDVRSERVPA